MYTYTDICIHCDRVPVNILDKALQRGDVNKVKRLYDGYSDVKKLISQTRIFEQGIKNNHIEIVKYALTIGSQCLRRNAGDLLSYITDINILDLLNEHRMFEMNGNNDVLIADIMDTFAVRGNILVLQWFLQHGYAQYASGWVPQGLYDTQIRQITRLYHTYHVPNYNGCSAFCENCVIEKLNELWEMDTDNFTNVIQWMPREIVTDVIELMEVAEWR